jgi:hypothetical protein
MIDRTAPVIRNGARRGYAFGAEIEGAAPPAAALASHWIVLRGRRIALQKGVNIVGRDPEADVWLDGTGISRRHAHHRRRDGRAPRGSGKNDDIPRGHFDRQVNLQDGDQIGFGAIRASIALRAVACPLKRTRTRARCGRRGSELAAGRLHAYRASFRICIAV